VRSRPAWRHPAPPPAAAVTVTACRSARASTATAAWQAAALAAQLGGSQANISAHLTRLKQAGLITSRAHGRAVYYRLTQPELGALLQTAGQLLTPTGQQATEEMTQRREKPSGQIAENPPGPQLNAASGDIGDENLQSCPIQVKASMSACILRPGFAVQLETSCAAGPRRGPGELIVAAISASFDNKAPMRVTCSRPLL
jgi:DNA-binding transcriptional ArsR family regulator